MQTSTPIRNLDEAAKRIRQLTIKQLLRELMLRYGFDDLLRGLQLTYKEEVFARAKHVEQVQARQALLDEMLDRLERVKGVNHEQATNGEVLRMRPSGGAE